MTLLQTHRKRVGAKERTISGPWAFLPGLLIVAFLAWTPPSLFAETMNVIIGTGSPAGLYYPTGTTMAKLVNQKSHVHHVHATAEATTGSVFNINAVMASDFEFGIVQADRQYQAFNGLAEWRDKGPQQDLRSVFSLYPEVITLCATVFSGIRDIRDLKGKRVNIGIPGSGQRQHAIDALQAVGFDWRNDLKTEGLKATQAPGLLQDGRLDAFFYTVGHPSDVFKQATQGTTRVRFITITGIEKLLANAPYYTRAYVPAGFYPGAVNSGDVETFGVKLLCVTSVKVPKAVVYALTKEVFENLAWFRSQHPVNDLLTKVGMLEGLSAPIHPGAMQYYQEAGLK